MKTIAIFLCSLLAACGGDIFEPGDGGGADSAVDGKTDAPPCDKCFDGGPTFSCGDTFCSGAQICIHPCCGGPIAVCQPLDDGGLCPQGLQITQTCPADAPCGSTCDPPPPYCGTTAECSMPQGHDCYLLCE